MNTLFTDTTPPADPFPLFEEWFNAACGRHIQPNPNAMTLATVDPGGAPSVRVVLLKHLVTDPGYVVFFTNYRSRKARAIAAYPRVGACLHWDTLGRQVRLEGLAVISPEDESDAYFATRDPRSRLGAWGSDQSEPIASREQLIAQTEQRARELGVVDDAQLAGLFGSGAPSIPESAIPRPPHWGGYRLWVSALELWSEGPARVHDRFRWERTLTPASPGRFRAGPWSAHRLQP